MISRDSDQISDASVAISKRHEQEKLQRTAWHEAGHSVVAWAMGWTVESVSVVPRTDGAHTSSGHVKLVSPLAECEARANRQIRQVYMEDVTICLAGAAAQHLAGAVIVGDVAGSRDFVRCERNVHLLAGSAEAEAALWEFWIVSHGVV